MHRTTVYLPEEVRRAIKEAVRSRGVSEASFIRGAIERAIADAAPPRPRLPLFSSGDETLAERVDEALSDFGAT
jgi:Arc/MetJ-type ribon-helix-helix transcriptional regulator